MAFGNNLLGKAKRATFQTAGGTIIKFRHPFLAGQLGTGETLAGDTAPASFNEIDVSSSCMLDDEYLTATPVMNSSTQKVTVDGSTITITNDVLAGVMKLKCFPTTGLVVTGDFIAACQLVVSSRDSVGGVITVTEFINGKAINTIFYGVAVQNCPHKIKRGNDVPVYDIELSYAGWIQTVSESSLTATQIWAAGSKAGISAIFKQFGINQGSEIATKATQVGTQLGDASLDDSSQTNGVVIPDAAELAKITKDQDIIGVAYEDGVSVVSQDTL